MVPVSRPNPPLQLRPIACSWSYWRMIIWPLLRRAEARGSQGWPDSPVGTGHPGFFAVHIDCRGGGMEWAVEQET